jgi:hypothetical protein
MDDKRKREEDIAVAYQSGMEDGSPEQRALRRHLRQDRCARGTSVDGHGSPGAGAGGPRSPDAGLHAGKRCPRGAADDRQERQGQARAGYTWAEPGYRVTQPSDRFLLASCSKMFLEAAVQSLYDAKKLSPATNVYPLLGFSGPLDARSDSITVQQLSITWAATTTPEPARRHFDPTYAMREIAIALNLGHAVGKLDVCRLHSLTSPSPPAVNSTRSSALNVQSSTPRWWAWKLARVVRAGRSQRTRSFAAPVTKEGTVGRERTAGDGTSVPRARVPAAPGCHRQTAQDLADGVSVRRVVVIEHDDGVSALQQASARIVGTSGRRRVEDDENDQGDDRQRHGRDHQQRASGREAQLLPGEARQGAGGWCDRHGWLASVAAPRVATASRPALSSSRIRSPATVSSAPVGSSASSSPSLADHGARDRHAFAAHRPRDRRVALDVAAEAGLRQGGLGRCPRRP